MKLFWYPVLLTLVIAASLSAQEQKVTTGTKVMVVAHPLAARAGVDVFQRGGNVVDAAVAAAYCLGVVEPHGSGIGGEGMMLIYDAKSKTATVVDFKAISPASASYRNLDFSDIGQWRRTQKAASVPGAVAGLELAREKFGRLERSVVLRPAIDYALQGFEVDSTLALNLDGYKEILLKDDYARSIYYADGKPAQKGTLVRNPDYGRMLQRIQSEGPEAFYLGEIARSIAQDARRRGAFLTEEDLAAYKPVLREPVRGTYRQFEIVSTPPPCGGMHLMEALNILEYFDLAACRGREGYDLHLLAEACKLVFRDEAAHNADPAFRTVPVEQILSDSYAFERLQEIDLAAAAHPVQTKAGKPDEQSTTHLSVADAEGNAVSLTITLSSLFGTGQTVEGTGFMLNNEMQNFNPDSTAANSLQPHKRVVTSLVPTMILDRGQLIYVLGTPGGDLILSTMTQLVVNLLDYHMSLAEAVAAPRLFSTFYQRGVEAEGRFPDAVVHRLKGLGHDVELRKPYLAYFGAVQAIQRDPVSRGLLGVSDSRRSGAAVGE